MLNVTYYLYSDPNFLLERNLNEPCLAETDCVTSKEVNKLTGQNHYLRQIFEHPSYLSDNICNLLFQIRNSCLIEIDL